MFTDYTSESGMPGSFEDKDVDHAKINTPNTPTRPGPPTSPTLNSLSGAVITTSRPSQRSIRPFTVSDNPSSVERNTKVRVVEISRQSQSPRSQPSQLHTFLHLQHSSIDSWRVRAALTDGETTTTKSLYERDKAVWLQKAATYERQLQEISAAHAVTEREFRETIDARLHEISSLRQDLVEKNSVIEGIGLRCDELNSALAVVRNELKEERENSRAEREQEIRNLEARLMGSIQQPHTAAAGHRRPADEVASSQPPISGASPDRTPPSSPYTRLATAQSAPRTQSLSQVRERSRPERPSASSRLPHPLQPSSDDDDLSTDSPARSGRLPPLGPPNQRQHAQAQAVQKAVDAEKKRFKKSADRNVHLTQVRRLFTDTFQAPTDEDFYSVHIAAPRGEVDKYLDGEGPGPDTDDLHFTDQEPYNNAWNCAVCSHLAKELWNRQRRERWTMNKGARTAHVSEAYWEDAVLQKFKRMRKGWIDTQCKVVQDPTTGRNHMESQEEADARRYDRGEEIRTVARQRERRFKRWDRRLDICTTKMQLAAEPFEKTRWREFLEILQTLGKDGMSSDESTEEESTHRRCYRVSLLPWRCDFDAIMEAIDVERLGEQSGYSKRGSVPTARNRQDRTLATSVRVSRRPPVTKLPATFYNGDWISGRSKEYVDAVLLRGSEQGYEWVNRVAEAYSGGAARRG